MIGVLPKSIEVDGTDEPIRTDFRDILVIFSAFNDEELSPQEKYMVCLTILYENFQNMNEDNYEEAYAKAIDFLTLGMEDKKNDTPKLMDWEQDENILFPAVNRVAGREVRALPYLHWWTFYGYFMEIQEGVFSHVLSLRQKKASGKKLEKWERDFWNANKDICELKTKLTAEEQAAKDRLNALLG